MCYNEDIVKEQFHFIPQDLRSARFPTKQYESGMLEEWLFLQFDDACTRQEQFTDQVSYLDETLKPFCAGSPADLWLTIIADAFDMCKSTAAKKCMWGAIAQATLSQDEPSFIKQSAAFLYERAQWMPKNIKEKRIAFFAGSYSPEDYRLHTLLAAAQRLQQNDAVAKAHLGQWLKSISMAPGVLPIRKRMATPWIENKDEMRRNKMLWREVVVPFCRNNPQETLLSNKIFFYLPISPTLLEGTHLIESLKEAHQQQWAYANIVGLEQTLDDALQFWEQAFPDTLPQHMRDFRLHVALLQLDPERGKILSENVDLPTVAMLESLGDYSKKSMTDVVHSRWINNVEGAAELPKDWYDEVCLDF